jgi:hypothetical protein
MEVHPPTYPEALSSMSVKNDATVDSVCPYPSIMGQQKTTFKKSRVYAEIGAAPVNMYLTLPPTIPFVFAR